MPVAETEAPRAAPVAPLKPNPRNNPAMFQIFQNVQYNVVQHKKYVKEMIKLYKKLDEDIFRESFKNALLYLFTFGDTSANVDRVVQYVATFCTSLDDEEEFLLFIFDIIFECQCVSGQSVRYRASQLLAAVLSAMGDDASLDDDLCDKLLRSQMHRFQDTRGAVRCRAALALQRLQNPMDQTDEVTRAYHFHMSCDPSSSVRRAVVMTIAKCTRNISFVLQRLCDVDEAVRRAAYLYVSALNVTMLRVRQRVLTLKVGLTERSQRVRRVVEEILIPGWLSSFGGNIVKLLEAIRLDNLDDAKDSQYVAGKLLETLFKKLPISELLEWLPTDQSLHLIPAEKLNKETAWYWRHLAEHLQKINDDETLETILPDLVVLTGYIRAILESPCPEINTPAFSTRQYVLRELGSLLRVYDATDPSSRTALKQLISEVLTGDYGPLNSDVIRAFVSALELVVPDVAARVKVIGHVISALRDPPEPEPEPVPPPPPADSAELKLQRARLRVSLNVAMEAQEEAVRDQNYALATECKAKVADIQKKLDELGGPVARAPSPVLFSSEKLSDVATLDKCLTILNCALDTPQLTTLTPNLRNIFSELETEIFQNPELILNGLETVALFGMLDKEFAKEYKSFFFANLVDMSNEAVVNTALRCMVDLLCVHGALVFEEEDNTQNNTTKNTTKDTTKNTTMDVNGYLSDSVVITPTHGTTIQVLVTYIENSCPAYRLTIVEGFCRLLHLGHLESPTILSRLLLLWFNPATADEDMLRQTIGVFFETFPVSVDEAQDQIQKATIPTLRTLANAPASSPLAEIDQEAVVRFIVSLTRVNHELSDSQGGMAAVLCQHIARHPDATEVGLACRMLALLSPPRDASMATSLASMLRELSEKLPDKQSCRNLTRYLGALEAFERASMNKMSNTGITEGTLQEIDSLAPLGRTTSSLPQPIARSTHVVINETVEEEVEIDESSPTEDTAISRISAEGPSNIAPVSPKSSTRLSEVDAAHEEVATDSSSGVSPVKKARTAKGKKKVSLTMKSSAESKAKGKDKEKQKESGKQSKKQEEGGGVKRSRSQRSLVDVERAQKAKQNAKSKKSPSPDEMSSPSSDFDTSNVTVRNRGNGGSGGEGGAEVQGKKGKKGPAKKPAKKPEVRRSTRASTSSVDEPPLDDSDDASLHTIIYDKEMEQSLLNDSSELADTQQASKGNVTIPETPDASDESECEPEPEPKPTKGKRNAKKK